MVRSKHGLLVKEWLIDRCFQNPHTDADWFYAGFAYHLLGKSEVAKNYFEMSSGFAALYYDELELKVESCAE